MSKSVCGRWDLGEAEPGGCRAFGIDGYRFEGTPFAMMFDRRWQFIALQDFVYGSEEAWPDFIPHTAAMITGMPSNRSQLALGREALLELAQEQAKAMLQSWDPITLEHTLLRSPLTKCRSGLERTKLKVLMDVLKLLAFDPSEPPTAEMRSDWLVEGSYRWGCKFPTTLSDMYGDICEGANHYKSDVGKGLTREIVERDVRRKRLVSLIESRLCLPPETWAGHNPLTENGVYA